MKKQTRQLIGMIARPLEPLVHREWNGNELRADIATLESDGASSGATPRDTYVGSVSITLADGRRVIAFTRNTVAHARDLMAKALFNPSYRNRFVSIIPAR